MTVVRVSFFSAFLISAASFASANPNLLVNGSFETGDFTGWTQGGNLTNTFVTTSLGATDGSYAAALGPIGSTGTLSQTFATEAGKKYTFAFDLRNDSGHSNNIAASFDGVNWLVLTSMPSSPDFKPYSFNLVASGTSTSISFLFRNDVSDFALDNVSVSRTIPGPVVPAPAAIASFGLGLAARVRRRRKA